MIKFDSEKSIFYLNTKNAGYIIGIMDNILPVHLHWGGKIEQLGSIQDALACRGRAMSAASRRLNGHFSEEVLPLEYSPFGTTDMRHPSMILRYADRNAVGDFRYDGYEILNGKPALKGLPAVYCESGDKVSTLIIRMTDRLNGLSLELSYSVFEDYDAITRSVKLINRSEADVGIDRIYSANIDFAAGDFEMLSLTGAWARERFVTRVPLANGTQMIDSMRGASGLFRNPFYALVDKDATETAGDVYGVGFVYSGNFTGGCESDTYGGIRAFMGINPSGFEKVLKPGDCFTTPEVALCYSNEGISGMSRIYHRLYRERLCRGKFRDIERDVLINNWEATYFNFDEQKISDIAEAAAKLGLDLMVLDDGWFGKRNNDNCSLGDWVVNMEKLPNGIKGLAEKVNALGMKFGLWFEPEMISEDSDLYRAHPDWRLPTGKVAPSRSRNQLVLDMSRKEVQDYVIESVSAVLRDANIEYVKWDMNRNMTELPYGSITHDYMLGLYRVLEEITTAFPNVLFESCSSGGGRFDAGMLYYMPQVWTSDDSDAMERLSIQYGTSICYPYSAMGAHISAVPNHQTGRTTPLSFRADVATPGQLGFELNVSTMTDEEKQLSMQSIALHKQLREVFHKGDLYRLRSPFEGDATALEFISQDKNTVIVCYYVQRCHANSVSDIIRLCGLDANAIYRIDAWDKSFGGDFLMNRGIVFNPNRDYKSEILVFKKQ